MKSKEYQYDVVIIGGGIAGISTAIDLLDSGKRVLIIDRDTEENFGGLAKESFGGMFFINSPQQRFSRIKDRVEQAKKDWFSFAEFDEDEYWGKQWAESFIESTDKVYKWVTEKGVRFFPVVHWVERGCFVPETQLPVFIWCGVPGTV